MPKCAGSIYRNDEIFFEIISKRRRVMNDLIVLNNNEIAKNLTEYDEKM